MSEWQPLEAGTIVRDRYEVEALLGKGGFGATYRARDRERFDQPCALKELLPAKATNPKVLEGSRYYLVQDFVAGATLEQVVELRARC
jgi:serine/threonine protein kinase